MKILKFLLFLASLSVIYTSAIDGLKANLPPFAQILLANYQIEIGLVSIIIFSIFNYYRGKRKNQGIATRWVRKNLEYFKKSFKHIGVSNTEGGPLIAEDSPHCYKFMATGRNNIDFFLTTFELKKRQDLYGMIFWSFVSPEKDLIHLDISLNLPQNIPCIFGVIRKRESKNFSEKYAEIRGFCKKARDAKLNELFLTFSENEETLEYIIDKNVSAFINRYHKYFQQIFITDQGTFYKAPLTIRVSYSIKGCNGEFEEELNKSMIQLSTYLADRLSSFKMSSYNKATGEKERKIYEERKTREQEKKIEEEKKSEQKPLTKEQIKKAQEREEKKMLKKKYPRKVMK